MTRTITSTCPRASGGRTSDASAELCSSALRAKHEAARCGGCMNRCLTVVADASSRTKAQPAKVSVSRIGESITRIIVRNGLMVSYLPDTMTLFAGPCSFRKVRGANQPMSGHASERTRDRRRKAAAGFAHGGAHQATQAARPPRHQRVHDGVRRQRQVRGRLLSADGQVRRGSNLIGTNTFLRRERPLRVGAPFLGLKSYSDPRWILVN